MGLLIKQNGEMKMVHPDELQSGGLSKNQLQKFFNTSSSEHIQAIEIKNEESNLLTIWYDDSVERQPSNRNTKASIISTHFLEKEVYGDVWIEGDILAIMSDLKINIA